jgi:ATP-dependent DNA helicase RecG
MSDIKLTDDISNLYGVGKYYNDKLKTLGILTIKDLLWHFPFRYQDFTNIKSISDLNENEVTTIIGKVSNLKSYRTYHRHMLLTEGKIIDESGKADIVWFNQPFIAKQLKEGTVITVSGKPKTKGKHFIFQSPAFEIMSGDEDEEIDISNLKHTGRLIPVYPETSGVSSKMLRTYIKRLLDSFHNEFVDALPAETIKRNKLMILKDALNKIHFPDTIEESELARKRFIFEEMLLTQLHLMHIKNKMAKNKAPKIKADVDIVKEFLNTLPFILTNSQKKAI